MSDTILLIEDSEDDVFFMQRAMKTAKFTASVQVAKDGREALDYLQGNNEYANREKFPLPRLVLLDLKLPHMLGLDLLKWMRAQPSLQPTPIIVLTSSAEQSDLDRAYRLGANSFLVKPSDSDDLVGLAACLKDYWFKYNLLPKAG